MISPRVRVWEGDKRVSRLLNVDQGKWNTEMVRELFLPLEADLILGIPISSMAPKDELVWAMSPNGTFSVNSAYKVVVKLLKKSKIEDGHPGCSDNSKLQSLWKNIWGMKCPNKIRHFTW